MLYALVLVFGWILGMTMDRHFMAKKLSREIAILRRDTKEIAESANRMYGAGLITDAERRKTVEEEEKINDAIIIALKDLLYKL